MSCRVRVVPALLAHVNLLLALVSGAGVVTAARLKWDPSTYVPLREVFPQEYRVAGVMLVAAALALLLLLHLATVALALHPTSRHRRRLLIVYAGCMSALACAEAAWGAWSAARAAAWLRSADARRLAQAMEARNHLRPVLDFLGRWHPLPHRVSDLIKEAEADVPCNLYVAVAMVALLATLQVAAVVLAALAASATPRNSRATHRTNSLRVESAKIRREVAGRTLLGWASAGSDDVTSDKAPLRAVYRNGRLVMV